MSIWDYLDRHEIIGTLLVLVLSIFILLCAESILVSWAKAWAVRRPKKKDSENG